MKKSKKQKWLFILSCFAIVLLIGCCFMPAISADVGNNNRYEGNEGTTDGGDFGFVSNIFYFLFGMFGPLPAIILLIVIVAFIYWGKHSKTGKKIAADLKNIENDGTDSLRGLGSSQEMSPYSQDPIAEIQAIDPAFSSDLFLGWVREVFIKIQQAWTNRDWTLIRPFESNSLFSQHAAQLEEYIKQNKINKIEKIAIQYAEIKDFRQDGDKEVMTVELRAVFRDYVVDATTNQVLESDPNRDWNMRYLMTFERKTGVKTNPGTSNKSATNCPNCGAPTQITSSGQCQYCGSVITIGDHDWVLSNLSSI